VMQCVLQSDAVGSSVLQCVEVCATFLRACAAYNCVQRITYVCVVVCCSAMQCVLQCVVLCCIVMRCVLF